MLVFSHRFEARVRELENIRNFLTSAALILVIDLFFTFVFLAVIWRLSSTRQPPENGIDEHASSSVRGEASVVSRSLRGGRDAVGSRNRNSAAALTRVLRIRHRRAFK